MPETPSSVNVSTKLLKVAELARQAPGLVITNLAHHIDIDFLHEAYLRTRRNGAPGIDGRTWKEYGEDLEGNLRSLLDRFKSGSYRAPAVRRAYIPKGDGKKSRPIGIPTLEDKVLQRAVAMVLEAVYEQDFLDCSHGFRPNRSAHTALESLWKKLMLMGGGFVLEVDIKSFFDNLDHSTLRGFLDQRVRDGVIRRVIDKWLKAGVFENGEISFAKSGSPQGGVISPCLSNIYLHEVLDKWFEYDVKPRLSGPSFLIRYADDFVIVFKSEMDARRVWDVLPKRLGRYGLTLHPEKTRLIRFERPRRTRRVDSPPPSRPGTFDLLGFTHYWGKSRRGNWAIKRKTAKDRFARAIKRISDWCRRNRHRRVREQHEMLNRKLIGHYQYYGIIGNSKALSRFVHQVKRVWRKWLDRRSQRGRMNWEKFSRLIEHYSLAPPKIMSRV